MSRDEHAAASKPGWAKAELERVRKLVESWPPYLRVHSSAYYKAKERDRNA